jgi:predicted GTPase
MRHSTQLLQSQLHQVLNLLGQHTFFSFTPEERQSLRGEVQEVSEKLAAIESRFLTIGLLGGTGVGKSTLMNALAGSRIASTSHRRPHTDEVLIYRHVKANPLPALALADIPSQEITHQSNAVQQILLCDLPDFDSLMDEHRRHVLNFLEHLDILVWVTSPEKYADGRFYEFLQIVPKAKQNFYFLLNKVDLLFNGQSLEAGYEQMARVVRSFQEHVTRSGIVEPLFYALAAEQVIGSDQLAPWNQFPAFRQQIFQQRDIKQVTAIKAANLDVEVQQLLSAFQKEVLNLQDFERILEASVKELEKQHASWVKAGGTTIDLWLSKHIRQEILSIQSDPSLLLGPGYTLAAFLQEWSKRSTEERNIPSDLSLLAVPEEIAVSFRGRLEWLQERLDHRILRQNLPSSFRARLRGVLDVSKTCEDLGERFLHLLALRLTEPSLPSFWGFKGLQFLTYLVLAAFFLLAIGGETAWREVLDDPGATTILRLLFAGVNTLFSTKGLAALGSYILLNLFFAIRFYRRYKRLSQRVTQQVVESLKVELGTVWQEKLDSILDDLNELRTEIRSQISTISKLREERNITS